MENLTLEDQPPQGVPPVGTPNQMLGGAIPPSQQNQQLPPQMFTTAAQLLDLTDSKTFLLIGLENSGVWIRAGLLHTILSTATHWGKLKMSCIYGQRGRG